MSVWGLLGIMAIAGTIGGFVNSLISDKKLFLPRWEDVGGGNIVMIPGFLGNMLVGAVAADVAWLMYGQIGEALATLVPSGVSSLALQALGGSVLVGMGGAAWLTNAQGKMIFRRTASIAAASLPSIETSERLLTATPVEAIRMVKDLQEAEVNTSGRASDLSAST